ncbi:hypothetical protein DPMN_116520 [Dreissena polymorpha]|uniref:Uncharacterized protein n=2 Tax=Dreissena polymorpha TaxID=45954 RepID=A0A9D4QTM1_DREPO|nr:hypothetical protein DPMN_116520 [Dreissena polymorpha]
MSAGLVGGIIAIVVVAVAAVVIVVVIVIIKKKNAKKVDPRIIDKEVTDVEETEKSRELDAVTPSVVKTEMSARNGVSHGKLTQVLGPEYTMSNATDEKKAEAVETAAEYHYVELHELESIHKLPPIETGHTPREALSPLDTQLKKSTLPAIK